MPASIGRRLNASCAPLTNAYRQNKKLKPEYSNRHTTVQLTWLLPLHHPFFTSTKNNFSFDGNNAPVLHRFLLISKDWRELRRNFIERRKNTMAKRNSITKKSIPFTRKVLAMLLTLSFTVAILFDCHSTLAQSKGNSEAQAEGKLIIDGQAIELKYAYARQRTFRQPAPQGLIDLLMTNEPLAEDVLTKILEVRYDGSDKLRGLWLIFDSSGAYKGERLLLERGSVAAASGVIMQMMQGNENTKIEKGGIRGKIECRIQSPTRFTTYAVSFDTPLMPRFTETGAGETSVSQEQFLKNFQNLLPGNWTIEKWKDDRGNTNTGTLSVHERIDEKSFRGTLHLIGANGAAFDEEVSITHVGTTVQVDGQVPPESKWLPDLLTFDLRSNLLVGGGTDIGGNLMNVVLRKIQ
jgi:hypothetical protein